MRIGRRAENGATLEVNICTAVPPKFRIDTREITNVFVPKEDRGTGLGSKLMDMVCEEADKDNKTLLLTCDNKLRGWYARFGFIVLQDDISLMARMPGSTPRVVSKITQAIFAKH